MYGGGYHHCTVAAGQREGGTIDAIHLHSFPHLSDTSIGPPFTDECVVRLLSTISDPGFATQLGESSDLVGAPGAKKMGLSPEEIAKIKDEWELKQRLKKEKTDKSKDSTSTDDSSKDNNKDGDKEEKKPSTPTSPLPGSLPTSGTSTPSAAKPTHQRYSLHRDFFAMRLGEHRKRRQAKQMQELAPRLPGAPRGGISS